MSDSDDPEARYAEILRRIEQKRAKEAFTPKKDALSEVLDDVNAVGVLADVKRRPPNGLRCYGPKIFQSRVSPLSVQARLSPGLIWLGAVMWYKPSGYSNYEQLGLLGVWSVGRADGHDVVVGTRTLQFSAPVFNPESYYHHIKQKFDVYYSGEASPPTADQTTDESNAIWYRAHYESDNRLLIRQAIEQALKQWRKAAKRDEVDD